MDVVGGSVKESVVRGGPHAVFGEVPAQNPSTARISRALSEASKSRATAILFCREEDEEWARWRIGALEVE